MNPIDDESVKTLAAFKCLERTRPCGNCLKEVMDEIDKLAYINVQLITDTAIAIRNNNGDYKALRLTARELRFAINLLKDLVPNIMGLVANVNRSNDPLRGNYY
jgi:hypothetical protein